MHIFAMFFDVQLGRHGADKEERGERQNGKTENPHQNRLYLGLFDVEKMRFFVKNALWLYSELCFLCRRGAHFQRIREKKWLEREKWSQNKVGYIKIPPKLYWKH